MKLKPETARVLISFIVYVAGFYVLSQIFSFNGAAKAYNGDRDATLWDAIGIFPFLAWGVGGFFLGGYLVDQAQRGGEP